MFKSAVIKLLEKATGIERSDIDSIITVPPNSDMGDYAFPCFILSKKYKKSPVEIAKELAHKLTQAEEKYIEKINADGPYVNFFISQKMIAKNVLSAIFSEKEKYGMHHPKNKKKIVVEYPSPNTNKPLHLGHIRNMLIGSSLSNILEAAGNKVYRVNLNNDRGIHICKSMLAYQMFGKGKNPDVKSDHFVGKYYVLFSEQANKNPTLEDDAQEMLQKWEAGDKKVRALWKKMNSWAIKGFQETYDKFGIKFDKVYNESEIYEKGKDIVIKAFSEKIFLKENDGSIVADLSKKGLGKKVLLRSDGTAVYITQDIYLAELKYKDFHYDSSIYVVGSEQNHHFSVLFELLNMLKSKAAQRCYHLSYGMISLPHGRMKSREGTVVDADDLISEIESIASREVKKRYQDISEKELAKRSHAIAMASLRFFMLKYDPQRDFIFNPEESISFEGETGPYLQYTYARINSIIEKSGFKVTDKIDFSKLSENQEKNILNILSKYNDTVKDAADKYKPSLIARYLIDLSQVFNEYYHSVRILNNDKDIVMPRLLLISAVAQVIKNGLRILDIDVLNEM